MLVALIPVTVISINMYREAWADAWREIREKHQLLAENLTSPIAIYVDNHREMLQLFAQHLGAVNLDEHDALKSLFQSTLAKVSGFKSLLLLRDDSQLVYCINRNGEEKSKVDFRQYAVFADLPRNRTVVSSVVHSPLTEKPAIFITTPLGGHYFLSASLGIEHIESLRRQIRFGKNGHSAIVDDTGRVIAHPNAKWMETMHDMSGIDIVQRMLRGETGVIEFYSPFMRENMVAGYAQVPGLGWGVMVPQPRSEVEAQVHLIMHQYVIWGGVSIVMAILAAGFIARRLTLPINALAEAAGRIVRNDFSRPLPQIENAPAEIVQMGAAFDAAVSGLMQSRREYEELNTSLQIRVEAATAELRDANGKLNLLAQSDHLTKLSNRRYFESVFNNALTKDKEDPKQYVLLLLDVDRFKSINDRYGHAAGDDVLNHVALVLRQHVRDTDLVARYGGDEFVALMDAEHDVSMQRAENIRLAIEQQSFAQENQNRFQITVSIGLLYLDGSCFEWGREALLKKVDAAMYAAKQRGRNTIVEVSASG